MEVTVQIPEQLASTLPVDSEDRARKLLEDYTAQAYRDGKLTFFQVQCALGLPTRMDVEDYLYKYGIFDYTVEMLESDLKYQESTLR